MGFFSNSCCCSILSICCLLICVSGVKSSSLGGSVNGLLTDPAKDFYEVLRSHGLPMGLLPKGVTGFTLDNNGRFEVHLDQACNAKFENAVHYDRNVTGILSYGQIQALSGIEAQELFLWFPVNGIRVDIPSSGLIYFDVGVIYKQFSLSLFETPPDCSVGEVVNGGRTRPNLLFREGKAIRGSNMIKNRSEKLRYEVDQQDVQRADQ